MYSTVRGGMQTGGDIGPAVESTFQLPSRAHQHCGLTVELARWHSANTGLGSPLIPIIGARDPCIRGAGKEASCQRPSVAGGLISQASRPPARHSWWAFEEDPNKGSFPVQACFAVGAQVCRESPRQRLSFKGTQTQSS